MFSVLSKFLITAFVYFKYPINKRGTIKPERNGYSSRKISVTWFIQPGTQTQ